MRNKEIQGFKTPNESCSEVLASNLKVNQIF